MNRKTVLLAFGIVVLLIVSTSSALVLLVRHEPDFYHRANLPPNEVRKKLAHDFHTRYLQCVTNIINEEKKWDAEFTEEQINSYLEEDFASNENVEKNFPTGIREPRVSFDPSKFRFAFRYGEGKWSTVVALELKVWLAATEPNVVALQLEALTAGSLPITAQSVLDRFAETLRQKDIEVTWYRHEGKPVALLRFQPGRKTPTVLLRNVKLEHGRLHIGVGSGGTVGGNEEPTRASLAPETVRPLGN